MGVLRTAVLAGSVAAGAAVWWFRSHKKSAPGADALPLAVTVHRSLADVADDFGRERGTLAVVGLDRRPDLAPAPGTFGTEIRIGSHSGDHRTRADARQALRQAKQLLETGQVMPPDRPITRRRTLTSIPVEIAIRRAGRGGRL